MWNPAGQIHPMLTDRDYQGPQTENEVYKMSTSCLGCLFRWSDQLTLMILCVLIGEYNMEELVN